MVKINICCLQYYKKVRKLEEEIKFYKAKCEKLEQQLQGNQLEGQEKDNDESIMGLNLSSILELEEEEVASSTPSVPDLAIQNEQQRLTRSSNSESQEKLSSEANVKRQSSSITAAGSKTMEAARSKTMEGNDGVLPIYRADVFDVTSTTNSIFGNRSSQEVIAIEDFLSLSHETNSVMTPENVGELSLSPCVLTVLDSQSTSGQEDQNIPPNQAPDENEIGEFKKIIIKHQKLTSF